MSKPSQSNIQPYQLCKVYFGLGFLLSYLGQHEKASRYEGLARKESVDARNAAQFFRILVDESQFSYNLKNRKKSHKFSVLAFELMERSYEELSLEDMLYSSLIQALFYSGERQLVDKLIKLVALKIRDRGVLDSDINSLHAFVHRCSS